jgi:hypothetical protein
MIETLATLVHEMTHCKQQHYGTPGRRGYHNKEWASFMDAVGLAPSSTGQPGGRRVGERVTHYVVAGGPFDISCRLLLTRSFELSWWDRFPPMERNAAPGGAALASSMTPVAAGFPTPGLSEPLPGLSMPRKAKVKYKCVTDRCRTQVWGKPGLAVLCGAPNCSGQLLVPAS